MNVIQDIGLDVHNDSIAIFLAPGDSADVRRYGMIGGRHEDVCKFIQKMPSLPATGGHGGAGQSQPWDHEVKEGAGGTSLWHDEANDERGLLPL